MTSTNALVSICSRKRVDFGRLLEAIARRDDSFGPLGVTGAFELYRWMVQSVAGREGLPFRWPTRWGSGSLLADLGGLRGCTGVFAVNPFGEAWRTELSDRIACALLDGGPMAMWRERMRIDLARPRGVHMLWGDDWRVEKELDLLFALATPTRRLREQLNTTHTDARFLTAVRLSVTERGWAGGIEYGVSGARWREDFRIEANDREAYAEDTVHTYQRADEVFGAFVLRTREKFAGLLTPACRGGRSAICASLPTDFRPLPAFTQERCCETGPNV